jgi:hypothetical protein
MQTVVQVVDTAIFEHRLKMAEAVLPFAKQFLCSQKNIADFLGVSPLTVSKMIQDGRFTEEVHYKNEGSRIVYNPDEIINYKLNPPTRNHKPKEAYKTSQEALDMLS